MSNSDGSDESTTNKGQASDVDLNLVSKPYRVLMVCLGNICRSPAAEAVLRAKASQREILVETDSCGTGGGARNWFMEGGFSYHEGDEADERMSRVAVSRGYKVTSRSRPLRASDLSEFDLIVGMDKSNIQAVETAREYWTDAGLMENGCLVGRVVMLSEFCKDRQYAGRGVPDPYYGDGDGFERVFDMIESSCDGLLDAISERQGETLVNKL